mgnify:CR=1 FL=1
MIETPFEGRVYWFGTLPPSESGIAEYSSRLVPLLKNHLTLIAIDPKHSRSVPSQLEPSSRKIYHLGNHSINREVYDLASLHPDIVVMHDTSCFNAIPLPKKAEHWQNLGVWMPRVEDLVPWLKSFLEKQNLILVHDDDAACRLRMMGVQTPVAVVPMPVALPSSHRPADPEGSFCAGVFGFMGSNRNLSLIDSICSELAVPLYLVGQPESEFTSSQQGTITTGWVSTQEWWKYMKKVHFTFNLRYPLMGEVSLTTLESLASARPVIVFDAGSYASLPDSAVIKIPPVGKIRDLLYDAIMNLRDHPRQCREMGWAGYHFIESHHTPNRTVKAYLRVLGTNAS